MLVEKGPEEELADDPDHDCHARGDADDQDFPVQQGRLLRTREVAHCDSGDDSQERAGQGLCEEVSDVVGVVSQHHAQNRAHEHDDHPPPLQREVWHEGGHEVLVGHVAESGDDGQGHCPSHEDQDENPHDQGGVPECLQDVVDSVAGGRTKHNASKAVMSRSSNKYYITYIKKMQPLICKDYFLKVTCRRGYLFDHHD